MTHFLHSRYAVAIAALLAIAAAFLAFETGRFPILPDNGGLIGKWSGPYRIDGTLDMCIALTCNIGIALLIAFLNKSFNLLRSMTMLQGSVFLCMQIATPAFLIHLEPGVALCLVVAACMFLMMANYGNPQAQRTVFLIFFLLSALSAFDYSFAIYIPLFWLACAQMRVFSLRSVIASLLGIVTPWIILLGFGIINTSDFVMPKISSIGNLGASGLTFMIVTLTVTVLVGLAAWVQNFFKILSYNAQSRAQLGMVTVCMCLTFVAMIIDFSNVYGYLPLFNCCVALQIGHLFGVMYPHKKSYWAILLVVSLFIAIYAWKISDLVY